MKIIMFEWMEERINSFIVRSWQRETCKETASSVRLFQSSDICAQEHRQKQVVFDFVKTLRIKEWLLVGRMLFSSHNVRLFYAT